MPIESAYASHAYARSVMRARRQEAEQIALARQAVAPRSLDREPTTLFAAILSAMAAFAGARSERSGPWKRRSGSGCTTC